MLPTDVFRGHSTTSSPAPSRLFVALILILILVAMSAIVGCRDNPLPTNPDIDVYSGPTLHANSAPIANAGEDQSIYLGDVAYLHGTASDPDGDPIVTWDWNLAFKPAGSNALLQLATTADPYFRPDVMGDYIVTLYVSDGVTQSAPDAVLIRVDENLPPTAVILADVATGPAPLTVHFDGTQSTDPEGRALTFWWNFGDGSPPSTDATPTHEYEFPGTYVAVLEVTDDQGQTDSDSHLIEVGVPINSAPVVAPTASPETGPAPLVVQFASNASDPDNDALSFAWNFGDGATSYEANPAHQYMSGGTYVAFVTVSDGQLEATGSVTIVVNVPDATTARLVATLNTLVVDGLLTFQNAKPLLNILAAVQRQTDQSNYAAAADNLENQFIPKVRDSIRQGKLPASVGQSLIDAAQALANQLLTLV